MIVIAYCRNMYFPSTGSRTVAWNLFLSARIVCLVLICELEWSLQYTALIKCTNGTWADMLFISNISWGHKANLYVCLVSAYIHWVPSYVCSGHIYKSSKIYSLKSSNNIVCSEGIFTASRKIKKVDTFKFRHARKVFLSNWLTKKLLFG